MAQGGALGGASENSLSLDFTGFIVVGWRRWRKMYLYPPYESKKYKVI